MVSVKVFKKGKEMARNKINKCGNHPRYKGKTQPTRSCPVCWSIWADHCPIKPSEPFWKIFQKFKDQVKEECEVIIRRDMVMSGYERPSCRHPLDMD